MSRPDRDSLAAAIRRALADIWSGGIVFSAADAIEGTKHHQALRKALEAALIEDAAQLGCWFRQHQGTRDGIVITRHGRKWVCMHIGT